MHGPYGWHMDGGGWIMMLLMALIWIAVVLGVVCLVVWLIRQTGAFGGGSAETPMDILKKRYARGEISQGEYERLKRELS